MATRSRAIVALASLALGLTVVAGPAAAQSTHIMVPADAVQWAPAPPMLPPGAQISVLEGNPSEKGMVTLRLKLPSDYAIPPHWHSMIESVTVLSGSLHVGMGDTLDRATTQTLEPGGFVSLPSGMHHYVWVASPTVVQVNLEGPFDIHYVNSSEDPQNPQTRR
jgi:hypothetical protein